ncbi:MAG: alpha/beta hydrolase [Desulfobacterales bacterium]|jgi:alpha-beta hydrolase superfamily lysophospholipase
MVNSNKKPIVEEIRFLSDNYSLEGYLHLPPVDRPPLVIGCHGLLSDRNSPKQIQLAKQCNQNGIAYFRFDHRGCGQSNAPLEQITSLEARCTDLRAAARMLRNRKEIGDQLGLFGSSFGGVVCLATARHIKADALVTWAAPIRSFDLIQNKAAPAERSETAASDQPFRKNPFEISDHLAGIQNILIFHGDADETVPLPHAQEIYQRVSQPKKLVVFSGSDHRMSNPTHQKDFIREAARWFYTNLNAE